MITNAILTVDELFRIEEALNISGGNLIYDSYAEIYERLRKGKNALGR